LVSPYLLTESVGETITHPGASLGGFFFGAAEEGSQTASVFSFAGFETEDYEVSSDGTFGPHENVVDGAEPASEHQPLELPGVYVFLPESLGLCDWVDWEYGHPVG